MKDMKDTHTRHVAAVTEWLTIEVGFVSDMGPEALYKAIIESLKNSGVLGEAGVVYIRGSGPGITRGAVDIFLPDTDEPEEETIPKSIVPDHVYGANKGPDNAEDNPACRGCGVPLVQFALHDENCNQPPPTDAEMAAHQERSHPDLTNRPPGDCAIEEAKHTRLDAVEAQVPTVASTTVEEGKAEATRQSRPDDQT